jgi:hypothetical protein
MLAHQTVDGLTALPVGHLGHAAGVDQADVGHLALSGSAHAQLLKHLAESGGLGEVQLAPQRVVGRRLALKSRRIYHCFPFTYFLFTFFPFFSVQRYIILSELHSKSLIKIKAAKKKEYLTVRKRLIISRLQKSYKNGTKKIKKNDTPYQKNVYLCSVLKTK